MVEVTFEYADAKSKWQWRRIRCVVESVEKCIYLYGLGENCEYRILKVKEVEK